MRLKSSIQQGVLQIVIISVWQHMVESGQNISKPFSIAAVNFGSAPACETDFVECSANNRPVDRTATNVTPCVCITTEAFDARLDSSFSQSSNPISRPAILVVAADVKICTESA
jgi:hypothetical protein